MAATWERLFSATLGSAATGMDTGVLANGGSEAGGTGILAREHLRIEIRTTQGSTAHSLGARFNGDTGTNYPITRETDGATESGLTGYNYWYNAYGGTDDVERYIVIEILNKLNQEKLIILNQIIALDFGVGNAPSRTEQASKWANTDAQITDIELTATDFTGSDTFGAGTTMTIFGADDQASTPVYPSLTNGTLFEESDTGKHYMFDGTSTWNEIT